jgi:beta-galactosidase/beta-glucuronidase
MHVSGTDCAQRSQLARARRDPPPHLAPPSDREPWRAQLEETKALGFNTLKCCLWVPPSVVYDLCDELGLVVWQEYPTWHPKMDAAYRAELCAEYDEFFVHDGGHPSVAFRSLTCETGQPCRSRGRARLGG